MTKNKNIITIALVLNLMLNVTLAYACYSVLGSGNSTASNTNRISNTPQSSGYEDRLVGESLSGRTSEEPSVNSWSAGLPELMLEEANKNQVSWEVAKVMATDEFYSSLVNRDGKSPVFLKILLKMTEGEVVKVDEIFELRMREILTKEGTHSAVHEDENGNPFITIREFRLPDINEPLQSILGAERGRILEEALESTMLNPLSEISVAIAEDGGYKLNLVYQNGRNVSRDLSLIELERFENRLNQFVVIDAWKDSLEVIGSTPNDGVRSSSDIELK